MYKAATLFPLLLLLLFSCQNTGRIKEKLPVAPQNTAYLKNTPLAINPALLQNIPAYIQVLYTANGNKTMWSNKPDRMALQEAVNDSASDGLLPADYNLGFLKEFEALTAISEEECMRYDVMMTTSFYTLATHLFKGKLQPSGVYSDWALTPKKLDAGKLLAEGLQNHNIQEVINRCRPRHVVYASLRKSLKYLDSLPDDTQLPLITLEKPVILNDSTATVTVIKQRLAYWGDLETADSTKVYNKGTVTAVKKFQQRHGIYADGIVNSRTAEALNFSRNDRREQVIVNLERWRWFPYDFGETAIIVNIPDYGLAVVEHNKDTVQTYKVIVGKPERRSPVLHSVLNSIVINPTWTVPPTILKEDLTPGATKDRSYFANLNMKIYKGDTEILPEDWDPSLADQYMYVQGPGDNNSLGRVKFNFRNTFSVYLHDTNHRQYFTKHYRALSSGCVRVQNPFKLAGYVLDNEGAGWTREKIDGLVAAGETKSVSIQKSIQVHQLYWTAWMDKGQLQFRNDIYNLDKVLYAKLRSQP